MSDGAPPQLPAQPGSMKRGVVKQVLSGDAVVLLGPTGHNGLPQEITVYLANITAPRLAKRPTDTSPGSPDEPFAWEAREFLRKKVIGQTVNFVRDFIATSGREHGRIYLGGTSIETAENVAETGVAEGWLEVRPGKQVDEYTQKLIELQDKAKSSKKGKWDDANPEAHVRDIKWNVEDPRALVDKYAQKPIKAVIEQVRDGSTVRAFLLPDFEYVTIMLSGIKAPSASSIGETQAQPFGEEAKFFVEQRILQRDVEVILEGASNQNFMGSVLHPRGNIAEFLLRDGYAKCVDWSMGIATAGAAALREAEKSAKDKKLRLWKNYTGASNGVNKKTFQATVTEVGLGDSLTVEKDDGEELKIYLSSIRPPRREGAGEGGPAPATVAGGRKFLPLYDIPYMFEAREFLRKKLVGKKASISIDYVQPKSDQFAEKTCATVVINGQNIAQQLVDRGLARVIRHRQDDDNRSSAYDALLVAEANAEKEKKGLFSEKKDGATVRVQELQGDAARSKQFLSYFQKSPKNDGVVDFVSSGSRLRIHVPKESVVITFLLGGITAPRGARVGPGGKLIGENEPFADEALKFTKKHTLQREVKFEVETTDKTGGFVGYLFVQREGGGWANLSEMLVENGLASVHFSAERGSYYNQLSSAERSAKAAKRGIWQNYVEEEAKPSEIEQSTDVSDRKVNYKKVAVSEVSPNSFRFAAQNFDDAGTIEKLMKDLSEVDASTLGSSRPRKNELVAVQFSGQWHRARVEAIKGDTAEIYYVDYGNRESISVSKIAPLPMRFHSTGPLAREYVLALVTVPNDEYYSKEAASAFSEIVFSSSSLLLNVEYKAGTIEAATLVTDDENKRDVGKTLLADGFALIEPRRENRFKTLLEQYQAAEQEARKGRKNIWQYGDFTGNEL